MQLRQPQRRGQTLLEAMVAIGVILAAVIGSSTLIITSITSGRISQNRVEAANFAREGVEVIRLLRDSNWLKFQQGDPDPTSVPAWNSGLTAGTRRLVLAKIISPTTGNRFVWQIPICNGACLTTVVGNCTVPLLQQMGIYKVTETATGRKFYSQYQSSANCNVGGFTCTATKYYRTVSLTNAAEDLNGDATIAPEENYLRVKSTVAWMDRTGCKNLSAESRLYDWK